MRFLVGLVCVGACFSPSPPNGARCGNGKCPDGLVCSEATDTCEPTSVDAATPVPMIDAPLNCYGTFVRVCPERSESAIAVAGTVTVSTTGINCIPYRLPDGQPNTDYCVRSAPAIHVASGGRLNVIGPKPLVLIGTEISIDGTVDIASHRTGQVGGGSDPAACVAGGMPVLLQGGPGGSFGTAGGQGGTINEALPVAAAPATAQPVTSLRGGCRGEPGVATALGGRGGGAVYLIATTLDIRGTINASGAAGDGAAIDTGGNGGGSGGMIVLEAAMISVTATGQVFANGGGGGEGGGGSVPGTPGTESTTPMIEGKGGNGGTAGAGNGGDGATSTNDGKAGNNGNHSGGGGGGGVGVIRLFGTQQVLGSISPPPS